MSPGSLQFNAGAASGEARPHWTPAEAPQAPPSVAGRASAASQGGGPRGARTAGAGAAAAAAAAATAPVDPVASARARGNEAYDAGRFREAVDVYSAGLAGAPAAEASAPARAALHGNRAAAFLGLASVRSGVALLRSGIQNCISPCAAAVRYAYRHARWQSDMHIAVRAVLGGGG